MSGRLSGEMSGTAWVVTDHGKTAAMMPPGDSHLPGTRGIAFARFLTDRSANEPVGCGIVDNVIRKPPLDADGAMGVRRDRLQRLYNVTIGRNASRHGSSRFDRRRR
ncbi:hypothetical protein [Aliiroseovarius sp. PTFE2010]|uniref:hypothetical protein n=1 Tax=Aliiroseovarius sp. PTFE2010 TaxID=3417190 RepID=UPI003CEB0052